MGCDKPAQHPWRCCSSYHGMLLNAIADYLKSDDDKFLKDRMLDKMDYRHPKELSPEERSYYLTIIK